MYVTGVSVKIKSLLVVQWKQGERKRTCRYDHLCRDIRVSAAAGLSTFSAGADTTATTTPSVSIKLQQVCMPVGTASSKTHRVPSAQNSWLTFR